MNIIFKKVSCHNFLSIGNCDILLDNQGYVIVDGINNNPDDMAKSNGSGKSAIFESIVWCLTGETIRGIKSANVVNIHGIDGTFVKLELSINGDSWTLLRSKDHTEYKTNFRIWKNGEEVSAKGIRDTEKLFSEFFPDLTPSLIGSVMVLGQGLPQRFTSNSPSGRKEVLEKLSKSDFMIEDLKDRIKHRSDELTDLIRESEDKILSSNTRLDILNKNLQLLETQLGQLEDISYIENDLKENKTALKDKKTHADKLAGEICKLEESIAYYNKEIVEKNTSYTEALSKIVAQEASDCRVVDDEQRDYTNTYNNRTATRNATIVSKQSEINKLKSVVDVCPTCGQKLVGVEKPDTTEMEKELSDIVNCDIHEKECFDKKNAEYNQKISDIKKKYAEEKQELLIKHTDSTSEATKEKELATKELDCRKSEKHKIDSDVILFERAVAKLESDVANYNSKKDSLLYNISTTKDDISNLEEGILYITKEKENFNERFSIISKFNTSINRDFRGILLSSLIKFIEERAKKYSMRIFETENISFELDGNNISINYNDKQYESLSGGEKQKVDLIVQFSIRDMLCKYLNFSCNILVLDEIFDNLDIIGCNKVIELLSSSFNDINSIYVVTHHSDLEIPYDNRIVVEKNADGVSSIK